MVDDIQLSESALDLIKSDVRDGYSMIASCRAILSGNFTDEVFNSNLLAPFEVIADESESIVLHGFGDFNSVPGGRQIEISENEHEVSCMYNFYKTQFQEAMIEFRRRYGI